MTRFLISTMFSITGQIIVKVVMAREISPLFSGTGQGGHQVNAVFGRTTADKIVVQMRI